MTEAHTQRAHATLAPSAAHRWMHCPGSIPMTEGIADKTTAAAAEGTAAHELAAYCLETGHDPATFLEMWVDIETEGQNRFARLDEDPGRDQLRYFEVTEEMVDAVKEYCTYVLSFAEDNDNCLCSVEERLDMTHLHPEIYGTGDATVLQIKERHLHVFDFKYGKGVVVEVDDNPQLGLYGSGAARRHHNHKLEKVTLHVIQPRAEHKNGPCRSREYDLIELLDFEGDIQTAGNTVDAARENRADMAEPEWSKAYLEAGDWCRFCPAQAVCSARRTASLTAAAETFGEVGEEITLTPPDELDDERLANILLEADSIGNYVKAVQEFAHSQACSGKTPKGFKLVAKRANRKWIDPDTAEDELAMLGVDTTDMYAEPKFRSPAQLERYFPGKNKDQRQASMAHLVEKKSSGTNLVPISDPRPAVKVGAAEEFAAVEGVE
jgi:hypothetical protein